MDQRQAGYQGFAFGAPETDVYSCVPTHYSIPTSQAYFFEEGNEFLNGRVCGDFGGLQLDDSLTSVEMSEAPDFPSGFIEPESTTASGLISPWMLTDKSLCSTTPDLTVSPSDLSMSSPANLTSWPQPTAMMQVPLEQHHGLSASQSGPSFLNASLPGQQPQVPLYDDDEEWDDDGEDHVEDNGYRCYAIHLANGLRYAEGNTLPLRQLYEYVYANSRRAQEATDNGWKNSVRHNLSMNEAFERVYALAGRGKKKSSLWRLTEKALQEGIQSTTRYRKAPKRPKTKRTTAPAPKRQQSGAKGGKATRVAREQNATRKKGKATSSARPVQTPQEPSSFSDPQTTSQLAGTFQSPYAMDCVPSASAEMGPLLDFGAPMMQYPQHPSGVGGLPLDPFFSDSQFPCSFDEDWPFGSPIPGG